MIARDFLCVFCGSVTKTDEKIPSLREWITVCPNCGCYETHAWNPDRYRWRNVLRAAVRTRRWVNYR